MTNHDDYHCPVTPPWWIAVVILVAVIGCLVLGWWLIPHLVCLGGWC